MTTYEVGLEQDKTDKIAAVAAAGRDVARELGQDPEAVATFMWHYFRHVDPADLEDRTVEDLLSVVESHYRAAMVREPGQDVVRVVGPRGAGGVGGATVLQVVTDDLPFLVDSVTMEVLRQGWTIREVFHPQFLVLRDGSGRLRQLLRSAQAAQEPETLHESWMHLELLPPARLGSEAVAGDELEQGVHEVLDLVGVAVADWSSMARRAVAVSAELGDEVASGRRGGSGGDADQARELLDWLTARHFTFLGAQDYDLVSTGDDAAYVPVPGTALGILRHEDGSGTFSALPRVDGRPALLVVTKGDTRSRVHRPAYLDYIGVRRFDARGEVVGEHRFLGLFSTTAYSESVMRVPVLRQKAEGVIARSGYDLASHGGKAIVDTLETYPRDELFQTPLPELAETVERIAHLKERRQVRVFARADPYGRFVSCLVYLPRDRYTGTVRRRMEQILLDRLGGASIDDSARVTDAVLARLHVVVRMPSRQALDDLGDVVDLRALERELTAATRTWDDEFADLLTGTPAADRLGSLLRALPEGYKEDYTPRQGRLDLGALADLETGADMTLTLYAPDRLPGRPADEADLRLKIFRRDVSLSLSQLLPHLTRLGVDVIDERPYELDAGDAQRAWIYDFGLSVPGGAEAVARDWDEPARQRFADAFRAAYRGEAESDAYGALVMSAGLGWREVSVLRAVGHYLRQAGVSYSQTYMAQALAANTGVARQLVDLFAVRFDPALDLSTAERTARAAELGTAVESALDDVSSLDQDKIIRSFLAVLRALVRTNFYRPGRAALALKLRSREVPDLPEPRPAFEIFVHSPRVEGVHLRFGLVARGGLRWSDRAEDFRTEILGLVKAQTVKNTVIVPTGAKGGFVPRQLPDPATDRDAWLAEGVACYRIFITSLLDVTDNLVGTAGAQQVVPPPGVVRHDGDDPYLVVAADKGTATFSDIANGIALEEGFWLGDAFASGGSAGYDHKAMGITARGAWESVRRHFRELGIDPDADEFTVVGIGDMSGDVFGNGMLLSEHLRLVCAFDHRHVFVDPDPDPATSFAERRRLFGLARSSWADYDPSLISEGGGVFPRSLKSITVTEPMRRALGLGRDVRALDPTALIHAALQAPVDLLWNGGIGTYVKAASEPDSAAGDKANDGLRVNGAQVRARCVGEGGNLGLTQLGRIEYATCGGKINTDFIDNSAGVDTSDHEVNIKILLAPAVEEGSLTLEGRNTLLASMTDDVAHLVLAHNVSQNLALATAEVQAPSMARVHGEWVDRLEEHGLLDREIEFLPDEEALDARRAKNRGLTSPELAVLLAYTKIVLSDEVGRSDLPDDPDLADRLVDYFPPALRGTYTEAMRQHRLHREIVTTRVVNAFVDTAGITCFHRLSTETGATAPELVRAHVAARALLGASALEARIADLDHAVAADTQTRMRLAVRTLVERATRWLVNERPRPLPIAETVDALGPGVATVVAGLPEALGQREAAGVAERAERLRKVGVPDDLAADVAALPTAFAALSAVTTAQAADVDPALVTRVHFALAQRLGLDRLVDRVAALPREDRWSTMARAALRDDLHTAHARLTAQVVADRPAGGTEADALVEAWERSTPAADQARATLRSVLSGQTDLAKASVALRVVRGLVGG
ncbi:NAD-glutamate dehydrogenase [Microlunatus flavus]|uniref:Glutamate dehydrogenase n=1 Tax=Microlunatus flavus TaxID=1036181 RepID=A0A1H9I7F2_9ACTN|nr:NAD-glutamate dehydrogenase [Microlunatus flavus]SEQ70497.1 glutamate dehydrogenase [Microlunatus flavus]